MVTRTRSRLRWAWAVPTGLLAALVGVLFWLADMPPADPDGPPEAATRPTGQPLHVGLVPERDVFQQRKRYQALAGYLSARLTRPVELLTCSTYETVLKDFAERKIDVAFLGSLVSVLAMDRLGAKVLAKPEIPGGISTYRGVIFVREDVPVRTIEDLAGRTVAMLRTTTAGNLFPSCLFARNGLTDGPNPPRILWVGTHDDVLTAVMDGQADVGAIKDLRLDALLRSRPDWKVRRLFGSQAVPNNALLVRADLADRLGPRLTSILLKMDADPEGRRTLAELGATRFLPCSPADYKPVFDMIDCVGDRWGEIGVEGPPPRRPPDMPRSPSDRCYVENFSSSSAP